MKIAMCSFHLDVLLLVCTTDTSWANTETLGSQARDLFLAI